MTKLFKLKTLLWALTGGGLAVLITRVIYGLGAVTNLTDSVPWGVWIGFDVLSGVALGAGGFVIAALSYIFRDKELKSVSRAAILTAFLGYIAVIIGLAADLGLPWNIWHAMIYWNPSSPLFEVAWCVMLYTTVLLLEFVPVILEKFPKLNLLEKINSVLVKIKIPLIIIGVMLSTLHQSSLGSLFLAMPYRIHELWYTPILPVLFFISAIALGFMMVMTESSVSSSLYGKRSETNILLKLSKYAAIVLAVWLAVRFGDLAVRGLLFKAFEFSYYSFLFWIEILFSAFIPLTIFHFNKYKASPKIFLLGSVSGVLGIILNRINVGGLTQLSESGNIYFPSWTEIIVSASIVSAAALVFFVLVENFRVWEEKPVKEDDIVKVPRPNSNNLYLGNLSYASRTVFSFAFITAFALSFAVVSSAKLSNSGISKVEAQKAKGSGLLTIDGNRDGYGVKFDHDKHQKLDSGNCASCHHASKPSDENTLCSECHADMYSKTDIFRHDWHSSSNGAAKKCFECHPAGEYKSSKTAKKCDACHDDFAKKSILKIKNWNAPSYTDAMHGMCIKCHEKSLSEQDTIKLINPDLNKCSSCHKSVPENSKKLFTGTNRWVILPSNIDSKN